MAENFWVAFLGDLMREDAMFDFGVSAVQALDVGECEGLCLRMRVRVCGEFQTFILGLARFLAGPANQDAREFSREHILAASGFVALLSMNLVLALWTLRTTLGTSSGCTRYWALRGALVMALWASSRCTGWSSRLCLGSLCLCVCVCVLAGRNCP